MPGVPMNDPGSFYPSEMEEDVDQETKMLGKDLLSRKLMEMEEEVDNG